MQKKNTVTLSPTAIARLTALVSNGTYLTLDDAANHTVLQLTGQVTPVPVAPVTPVNPSPGPTDFLSAFQAS